jgi:hypothetical protein
MHTYPSRTRTHSLTIQVQSPFHTHVRFVHLNVTTVNNIQVQGRDRANHVRTLLERFSSAGMKLSPRVCGKALGVAITGENPFASSSRAWAPCLCDINQVHDLLTLMRTSGQGLDDHAAEMVAGVCFTHTPGGRGLEADLSLATDLLRSSNSLGPGRATKTAMALLKCCVTATVPDSDCRESGRQARQVCAFLSQAIHRCEPRITSFVGSELSIMRDCRVLVHVLHSKQNIKQVSSYHTG